MSIKSLSVLLLFTWILANPVVSFAADWELSMGGGTWRNETTGDVRYKDNPSVDIDYLNYDSEDRFYAWGELRHPIPVLPNLRYEYANINFSDHSETGFAWEDVYFSADTYTKTKIEQMDMIIFYNIMNSSWYNIDLGLDVKYIDFKFRAQGNGRMSDVGNISVHYEIEEEDLFVPLLYGNGRVEIFNTGIGIEAEGKFIIYKSTTVADLSIKGDWLYDFGLLKAGIEGGYRYENLDLDQDDFNGINFDADVDIKGPFVGMVIKIPFGKKASEDSENK